MAKRYYINRILGDGSEDDPYCSELRIYIQTNWPDEPHFIKQLIHPAALLWGVMKYDLSEAAHNDVMLNVPGIFCFPETGLSRTMAEILSSCSPLLKRARLIWSCQA